MSWARIAFSLNLRVSSAIRHQLSMWIMSMHISFKEIINEALCFNSTCKRMRFFGMALAMPSRLDYFTLK